MSDIRVAGLEHAAQENFAELMVHVCNLFTCGESGSVSAAEATDLANSVLYVLGARDLSADEALAMLARPDLVRVWGERRQRLQDRVAEVMALWEETVRTMPSVRNIALRDTLESIGTLPRVYDAFFRAHEVPVSVDYPLSVPVDESLQGLDYLEVWLTQLLAEARFLARFNVNDMVAYLQSWCPDYQGLLINLYEPIRDAWKAGKLPMVGE
ncbi:MAG: DUF6179 domain-containing protein [Eggerthellales bacterium]|nr:DUF6179 domain-containing protein [Eggerthellales bacterium]